MTVYNACTEDLCLGCGQKQDYAEYYTVCRILLDSTAWVVSMKVSMWPEAGLCSMLTVMLSGDLVNETGVQSLA